MRIAARPMPTCAGCWLACLLAGLALVFSPGRVRAQTAPGVESPHVGSHRVTQVRIEFSRENPGHPSVESLLGATFVAMETPDGFAPGAGRAVALREINEAGAARFTDAGLALLAPAVVQRMRELGFVGVYATPDPAQFGVQDGRVVDLRPEDQTHLTLQVTTGMVVEVRSVGVGERVDPDETINNPLHERVRDNSPVQPYAPGSTARSDLLRRDVLEDYVFRLNRHPGRRVDVTVAAPGDVPGAVTLDYTITENRPWLIFGQASNTGSESTSGWREHFGFVHNNLTNHDDILSLDYQTANFDDVHALHASYERPFSFSDRLRWKIHGSWYQYVASELGIQDADFRGEGWFAGAEVAWNFLQERDLFVDLVAGARFEHVRVENELAAVEGDTDLLLPSVALRLERRRDQSSLDARIGLDFNLPDIAGTEEDLDALGRLDADDSFVVLRGEGSYALYLDPYFRDAADAGAGLVNEVFFSVKGQHALGSRLIPNEQIVAGGLYTVRGYPHAVVAGDSGLIGTAEYRFHLPRALGPSVEPGSFFARPFRWRPQYAYGPTDWDLIFRAFLDAGRIVNTDRQSFESDHTLVGAGIGVELALTRRFNARADLGFALRGLDDASGDRVVDAGHAELHVVITLVY
ncbi:MAG: ShlB/FhaC/HecB family hemolysin secretion/activation protein [Planctomycetota bacterium]|nr:ShlB/FhaC/HecB family hemolysin secretion/activation protein [Planctomycetota bacterium]